MTTETAVRERPILFNSAMVRAVLAGRKTQTRRVVKVQPHQIQGRLKRFVHDIFKMPYVYRFPDGTWEFSELTVLGPGRGIRCPYGVAGDRLWVREGFHWDETGTDVFYRADYTEADAHSAFTAVGDRWRPSIHMPRKYCRILLEVKSVRVERVQDITDADATAEGMTGIVPRPEFRALWDSINAKRGFGWDVNPWVWVVEFERVAE